MSGVDNADIRHQVLLYNSDSELIAAVAPFIEEGIARGEAVAVQVPEPTWKLLAAELTMPERVLVNPLGEMQPHPHQAVWSLRQLVEEELRSAPGVRVLIENVPDGDGSVDPLERARAEAVSNHVLAGLPYRIICLYHRASLPPVVLDLALRTHPATLDAGGSRPNADYEQTSDFLRAADAEPAPDPLEADVSFAELSLQTASDLSQTRQRVEEALTQVGVGGDRSEDFLAAVFEVAVNALLHGGASATVAVWTSPDRVLCRVQDSGSGLKHPLMGYEPPMPGAVTSGSGLWTARQLSDQLTATMEPEGFTVRLGVCA